jgi:transcriptional regulator with XRE-family HTH domain
MDEDVQAKIHPSDEALKISELSVQIGRSAKFVRKAKALSLEEVAARTGGRVSFQRLSLLERGKREWQAHALEAVAGALEVPVHALLVTPFSADELEYVEDCVSWPVCPECLSRVSPERLDRMRALRAFRVHGGSTDQGLSLEKALHDEKLRDEDRERHFFEALNELRDERQRGTSVVVRGMRSGASQLSGIIGTPGGVEAVAHALGVDPRALLPGPPEADTGALRPIPNPAPAPALNPAERALLDAARAGDGAAAVVALARFFTAQPDGKDRT